MSGLIRDIGRRVRAPINRASAFKALAAFHAQQHSMEQTVDMAIKFPSQGLFRVESIQQRSEIQALARAVAAITPRNILEIGTARGGTLFIWAHLASHKGVSCDIE